MERTEEVMETTEEVTEHTEEVTEHTEEKKCLNCGAELPEGALFCSNCGAQANRLVVTEEVPPSSGFFKRNKKLLCIGVAAVLGIGGFFFGVHASGVSALKKELLRDWSKLNGEDGVYIRSILDFSDDEIEYRIETDYSWLDRTIGTFDYKVTGKNKFKAKSSVGSWESYTVEFDDDKSMMIVSPALTSVDREEYWFCHD